VIAMTESRSNLGPLTQLDFEAVRDLAKSSCGISLHQGKKALVSSRLEKLVRGHGFASFGEYIRFVSSRRHGAEFTELIDTLTTNHSGFWREPEHFAFLQKSCLQQHPARVRIWSAACATGEEPYTLAMCALAAGVQNCQIAASDISSAALRIAARGEYEPARIAPLPDAWPGRYFTALRQNEQPMWRVSAAVRGMVNFTPLNLLHPFGHLGQFDIIFCRNVMIYFDQPTRDDLVQRLSRQLVPGGYLFTGHSESLLKIPAGLQYVQPAAYRKL
jgi:chemotaxis protein methyltransferase CheR